MCGMRQYVNLTKQEQHYCRRKCNGLRKQLLVRHVQREYGKGRWTLERHSMPTPHSRQIAIGLCVVCMILVPFPRFITVKRAPKERPSIVFRRYDTEFVPTLRGIPRRWLDSRRNLQSLLRGGPV